MIKNHIYVYVIFIVIIVLQSEYTLGFYDPKGRYDPVIGGIQITILTTSGEIRGICPIAFPAIQEGTDGNGNIAYGYGYITAGHCGDLTDQVYQPTNASSSYLIGSITKDSSGTIGTSTSDSAFILIETVTGNQAQQKVSKKILHHLMIIDIAGYMPKESLVPQETIIFKTGAGTWTTYGQLLGFRNVTAVEPDGDEYEIVDGVGALYDCASGDSGGVTYVMEYYGYLGDALIVGVHSGIHYVRYDSGLFVEMCVSSHYSNVVDDLGVKVWN